MGNLRIQLTGMSVSSTLLRLDECLLPDDREAVLTYLEMMEIKMGGTFTKKNATQQFFLAGGIKIFMKTMKKMIKDEVVLRLALSILELQKGNREVILEFIEFNGIDLLGKAAKFHEHDVFLRQQIPPFTNSVIATGANTAISNIVRLIET